MREIKHNDWVVLTAWKDRVIRKELVFQVPDTVRDGVIIYEGVTIPFSEVLLVDECLWYWEAYYKSTDKWLGVFDIRRTKEEVQRLLNSDQGTALFDKLEPLYNLGFEIPKGENNGN